MKRTISLIIQIAIVIATTMLVIRHQLPIYIEVNGYEISTNTSYFFVFLFIFMATFAVIHKILEMTVSAPKKIKKVIDYKKQLKGLQAVVDGLFHLSIANTKQALKQAKIASNNMPKHVMTHFLSAKAYMADGNYEKAKKEYRLIVKDPKNMSLAFNGLIEIASIEEQEEELYSLAKQAILVDDKNSFALLNLIDCQIGLNLIDEAKENIKKANKLKAIDKIETKLRLAEIAYVDAISFKSHGDIKQALKTITPYYELDVDYLDIYVNLLLENGQPRKAKNAVKKVWKDNPYYQVAAIWMELAPAENIKKVNHAKELLKDWSNSHIAFELVAKACVDAEIWGEAKDYLNKAIETEEKISHYLLMAKVEKIGFKDSERHEFWLTKAEKGAL